MRDDLINKRTLSLSAARKLVNFAIEKAGHLGVGGAIAVVDDGGYLICLERIDGTMVAASNIAVGKAATAINFKRPSLVLEETVTNDRPAMKTLGNATQAPFIPLKGAYPIEINREMVGAKAVAGAETGDNDETIALYALDRYLKSII